MFGASWKNPSRALTLDPSRALTLDPSRALQSMCLGQDLPIDLDLDAINRLSPKQHYVLRHLTA